MAENGHTNGTNGHAGPTNGFTNDNSHVEANPAIEAHNGNGHFEATPAVEATNGNGTVEEAPRPAFNGSTARPGHVASAGPPIPGPLGIESASLKGKIALVTGAGMSFLFSLSKQFSRVGFVMGIKLM
jgi:hypothetical protein